MDGLTFPVALGNRRRPGPRADPGHQPLRASRSPPACSRASIGEAAARFAFLMATPITAGAGLWELRKIVSGEAGVDLPLVPLAAGMIVSSSRAWRRSPS